MNNNQTQSLLQDQHQQMQQVKQLKKEIESFYKSSRFDKDYHKRNVTFSQGITQFYHQSIKSLTSLADIWGGIIAVLTATPRPDKYEYWKYVLPGFLSSQVNPDKPKPDNMGPHYLFGTPYVGEGLGPIDNCFTSTSWHNLIWLIIDVLKAAEGLNILGHFSFSTIAVGILQKNLYRKLSQAEFENWFKNKKNSNKNLDEREARKEFQKLMQETLTKIYQGRLKKLNDELKQAKNSAEISTIKTSIQLMENILEYNMNKHLTNNWFLKWLLYTLSSLSDIFGSVWERVILVKAIFDATKGWGISQGFAAWFVFKRIPSLIMGTITGVSKLTINIIEQNIKEKIHKKLFDLNNGFSIDAKFDLKYKENGIELINKHMGYTKHLNTYQIFSISKLLQKRDDFVLFRPGDIKKDFIDKLKEAQNLDTKDKILKYIFNKLPKKIRDNIKDNGFTDIQNQKDVANMEELCNALNKEILATKSFYEFVGDKKDPINQEYVNCNYKEINTLVLEQCNKSENGIKYLNDYLIKSQNFCKFILEEKIEKTLINKDAIILSHDLKHLLEEGKTCKFDQQFYLQNYKKLNKLLLKEFSNDDNFISAKRKYLIEPLNNYSNDAVDFCKKFIKEPPKNIIISKKLNYFINKNYERINRTFLQECFPNIIPKINEFDDAKGSYKTTYLSDIQKHILKSIGNGKILTTEQKKILKNMVDKIFNDENDEKVKGFIKETLTDYNDNSRDINTTYKGLDQETNRLFKILKSIKDNSIKLEDEKEINEKIQERAKIAYFKYRYNKQYEYFKRNHKSFWNKKKPFLHMFMSREKELQHNTFDFFTTILKLKDVKNFHNLKECFDSYCKSVTKEKYGNELDYEKFFDFIKQKKIWAPLRWIPLRWIFNTENSSQSLRKKHILTTRFTIKQIKKMVSTFPKRFEDNKYTLYFNKESGEIDGVYIKYPNGKTFSRNLNEIKEASLHQMLENERQLSTISKHVKQMTISSPSISSELITKIAKCYDPKTKKDSRSKELGRIENELFREMLKTDI